MPRYSCKISGRRVYYSKGKKRSTKKRPLFPRGPGKGGTGLSDGFFSRTALLLGEEALPRLTGARVAVAGVGGVGSYAVEALARSGIGSLLLIDSDVVAPSNLNRQIHATSQTIGRPKVAVMAERVASINPEARVEVLQVFLLPGNVPDLFSEAPDYIIDAVDTVSAKLALAELAWRRKIPIISVMGAGNKLDPARFTVGDIFETSVCPLCRVMRRELRRLGVPALQAVYSTEPPRVPATDAAREPSACGRQRQTPGSVAFVPAVAGLIAASVAVRAIAGCE